MGSFKRIYNFFPGEFRRCYGTEELIQIISWYEICYSIGLNLGPGIPVIFSWLNIKIGGWKIDKFNVVHILIALISLLIFIISWFRITDLSKELDKLTIEYGKESFKTVSCQHDNGVIQELVERKLKESNKINKCHENLDSEDVQRYKLDVENNTDLKFCRTKKYHNNEESILQKSESCSTNMQNGQDKSSNSTLVKRQDLMRIDIFSLCLSYGIIRYTANTDFAMLSMYAMSLFDWRVNSLSWVQLITSFSSYLIIFSMVYAKLFRSLETSFYCYVTSCSLALSSFVLLLVPWIIHISDFAAQVCYLVINVLLINWIYFHAQSSGKVLIFGTVSSGNACFIDSVRCAFGSAMRLFAMSTAFLFYVNPASFLLPLGFFQFLAICGVLWRHDVILK